MWGGGKHLLPSPRKCILTYSCPLNTVIQSDVGMGTEYPVKNTSQGQHSDEDPPYPPLGPGEAEPWTTRKATQDELDGLETEGRQAANDTS